MDPLLHFTIDADDTDVVIVIVMIRVCDGPDFVGRRVDMVQAWVRALMAGVDMILETTIDDMEELQVRKHKRCIL